MSEVLSNEYLEQELERYLDDNCRQFYNCVVSEEQIIIYVSGYLGDLDKLELDIDVKNRFPELQEKKIVIMDVQDRQERTDKNRQDLEKKIREQVWSLVQDNTLGANDITNVEILFTVWSRIGRGLGWESDGIFMQVITDPERRVDVEKALIPLAKKHNIPLKVKGVTLLRAAINEWRIFGSKE